MTAALISQILTRPFLSGEWTLSHVEGPRREKHAEFLATLLTRRYSATGLVADLERAEEVCRGGKGAEHDKGLPTVLLALLHDIRLTLFEASTDPAAADDVVRLGKILLGRTNGENHSYILTAHADVYAMRFQRSRSPADRDKAIEFRRRAQDTYSSGAEWRQVTLELHQELLQRWNQEDQPKGLDELIEMTSALLAEQEGEERVFLLRHLNDLLWARIHRTISVDDLNSMIEALRELNRLNDPPDGQDLSHLCYLLALRNRRNHAVIDLDEAVTYLDEAVAAGRASVEAHASDAHQMEGRLSNLFGTLGLLAESTGSTQAYNDTVEVAERAAGLFPAGSTDSVWLCHFPWGSGTDLGERSQRVTVSFD